MRIWPQKLGELLTSMCHLGVLNYLNTLQQVPDKVSVTVYGMLAARGIGYILLKMVIDEDGSHVSLLHEGGLVTMAQALDYLGTCLME